MNRSDKWAANINSRVGAMEKIVANLIDKLPCSIPQQCDFSREQNGIKISSVPDGRGRIICGVCAWKTEAQRTMAEMFEECDAR